MSGRYPRVPEVTGGPTPPVANTGACFYVVFAAFVLQILGLAKRGPEPKFDQGAASYSLSKDAIGKSRLRTVFVNSGMLDSFPSSDWACGVVKRAVSPVRGSRG